MISALQRERTQLGWERTAFSFMAVGILLGFRSGETLVHGHSLVAVVALLGAATAALFVEPPERRTVPPSDRHGGPSPHGCRHRGARDGVRRRHLVVTRRRRASRRTRRPSTTMACDSCRCEAVYLMSNGRSMHERGCGGTA